MKLKPYFEQNNVPIAISCSNKYAPYLSVMLQSIIENSSSERNYDIIVLNKDYKDSNKEILECQCDLQNFSIRFFDVNEYISGKNFYTKGLSVEAYFRMFLIDIMKEYDKILYFDVDIITLCDVGELYDIDIGDNYFAASIDINIVASYISGNHWKPYIDNILCLKDPQRYFQSGVMVLNLKELRKDFSLSYITDVCTAKEWRLFDQDILNSICQDKIYVMDMRYNVINGMEGRLENITQYAPKDLQEQWLDARKEPKIIHYVGKKKPWLSFEAESAQYFWEYAKRSKFYHTLIVGRVAVIEMASFDKKINEVNKKLSDIQAQLKQQKAALIAQTKSVSASAGAVNNKTPDNPVNTKTPLSKPKAETKPLDLPAPKPANAVLIRCQSVYQLFNAINLAKNVLINREIDIVLTATTDFSEYITPLKNCHLFRRVLLSEDTPETYINWRGLDEKQRNDIFTHPEKYVFKFDTEPAYSDYFIAVADEYNKIFYYYMISCGYYPNIHFYEDGMNSYILNNKTNCDKDFIRHELYGKHSFPLNIKDQYTYEPQVAINKEQTISYLRIPRLQANNKKIKKIYNSVFPSEPMPKEKYIFLEEAFYCDGIASTDVELVEELAQMVGKENIIIKLHPRNDYDRFTPRGFKVMKKNKAPWEMTLLNADLSSKVFVTVSSTSALTSGIVFEKPFTSIFLFKIMTLGKNIQVRNNDFLDFYKLLEHSINSKALQIFTPANAKEFKEEIFYIEGGIE